MKNIQDNFGLMMTFKFLSYEPVGGK